MKKMITIFMIAGLAAGCATQNNPECGYPQNECSEPVVYEVRQEAIQVQTRPYVYTQYNPCRCAYRPDPCREVLRPRVKEVVVEKPRRNCPPDNQTLNCGCGDCQTFRQPVVYQQFNGASAPTAAGNVQYRTGKYTAVEEIIPNHPDAYLLASSRVLNRFLKDTSSIYSQSPDVKLFVKTARAGSKDLPGGLNEGPDNMKKQIENSYTFVISDTLSDADYYLETDVDWLDTPSKTVPAIQYKVALYDNQKNKINEWVEVIKKVDNSESWL